MHHVTMRYDFAGTLLFPSEPSQNVDLQGIVTLSGPVSGHFEFDTSTVPTTPGVFPLPTAKFHGNFGGLKVSATGGTATVEGANDSSLAFSFNLPHSEFPVPVTTATARFDFITYLDFYFSRHFLPATEVLPSGDMVTAVQFTDNHGKQGNLSTDTNVHITSAKLTIV